MGSRPGRVIVESARVISAYSLKSLARGPYWWLRKQAASRRALVPMLARLARGLENRLIHRSDYARWNDPANLEKWWETRTIQLARLIPAGTRVIEFGAGSCRLPAHLDRTCTYFPSDLVVRVPGTIVCDLNQRPLPDLGSLNLDVAVFSGVLEYVVNVPAIVSWLSTQVGVCVVSYDAVDSPYWSLRHARERVRRRYFGYMNDYRPAEFVEVFRRTGFRCISTDRWESQELYLFARDESTIAPHVSSSGAE